MSSLPGLLLADATSRQPISLKLSARRALRGTLLAALLCAIYVARGESLWVFAVIPAATVLTLPFVEKRIDVDGDGITIVPLVGIRPSQHFRFDCLGPFASRPPQWYRYMAVTSWAQNSFVRVPITSGPPYKIAGLFAQQKIDFSTLYTGPGQATALSRTELIELLERYRTGHAPEPAAAVEVPPQPSAPSAAHDDGTPEWEREGLPFPPRKAWPGHR
jgi:hypothetical protein